MAIPPNQRIITTKFTRHELIRLAMACLIMSDQLENKPNCWDALRNKIREFIDEHDNKQKEVK